MTSLPAGAAHTAPVAQTAIILAGGASRRFGADKSRHVWRGRSLLDHVRAAAAAVCPTVLVLGGPHADLDDTHPGAGPLAALATAFAHLPEAEHHLLLLACDLPLLTESVLTQVARHPSPTAIVPRTPDGRPQPLVARYPRTCLTNLHPPGDNPGDASLLALLERTPVTYITPAPTPDWALNANRLDDLPPDPAQS